MASTFRHGQSAQVQTSLLPTRPREVAATMTSSAPSTPSSLRSSTIAPRSSLPSTSPWPIFRNTPVRLFCSMHLRGTNRWPWSCWEPRSSARIFEKTPLPRATSAMSNECKKLFGLMKFDVEGAVCNIGLEQELFFVPRDKYYSARIFSSPVARWARCAPAARRAATITWDPST